MTRTIGRGATRRRGGWRVRRALAAVAAFALALAAVGGSQADPLADLPWTNADVGRVPLPGSATRIDADDAWRVLGSGADVWNPEDAFHFVYRTVDGDIEVVARVASIAATDAWAKAGIMLRDDLSPTAAHALMSLTPGGVAEFIYRGWPDGGTDAVLRRALELPAWVRLERHGARVTGSVSSDGTHWETVGSADMGLSGTTLAGIAVTSRDVTSMATAILDGLTMQRVEQGLPPFVPAWACATTPLQPAYGATLYVAPDGSDTADGRAVDRPLRTLQRAAELVGPGDVVWLRDGVHVADAAFNRSGTPAAPIVVESYPGECAILDGAGLAPLQRLRLEGVSHMVVRNLIVRNSPSEGIYLGRSHDNLLSHLLVYGNQLSGILIDESDRNVVSRVVSYGNFDPPDGGNADGISVSSGSDNRIERCVTFFNSDDGVDTWRSIDTVVERCVSFSNGWQGGDGKGFKAGGAGLLGGTVVRYSVAFDNASDGFHFNSGLGIRFEHNTAFGNARYGFVAGSATLRRNLAHGNAAGALLAQSGRPNTEFANSWNGFEEVQPFASTLATEPAFLSLLATARAVSVAVAGETADLGALPSGATLRWLLEEP
jgi:parallel beta-helix repeat protein